MLHDVPLHELRRTHRCHIDETARDDDTQAHLPSDAVSPGFHVAEDFGAERVAEMRCGSFRPAASVGLVAFTGMPVTGYAQLRMKGIL